MYEGIEEKVADDVKIGYIMWEERGIACHHARTLFGDIVGDEELLGIAFVYIHNPIERIIIDGNCLFAAEGDWPALLHVIHLSKAFEDLRWR